MNEEKRIVNVRFTDDEFSDKQRTYYRRRGHEAVSWQKSDTGFCGCSSFDFFDDRAGTYENRVDSAAEGICPDSHMSYEYVSCKSTGVCRNRRSTYKADQSPYFLERSREFRDGNMRLHMLFFLSAIWCGCFCFFERNVRSIHEHCSRKRNLVISYIHSQDGQKHRRLAFSI